MSARQTSSGKRPGLAQLPGRPLGPSKRKISQGQAGLTVAVEPTHRSFLPLSHRRQLGAGLGLAII